MNDKTTTPTTTTYMHARHSTAASFLLWKLPSQRKYRGRGEKSFVVYNLFVPCVPVDLCRSKTCAKPTRDSTSARSSSTWRTRYRRRSSFRYAGRRLSSSTPRARLTSPRASRSSCAATPMDSPCPASRGRESTGSCCPPEAPFIGNYICAATVRSFDRDWFQLNRL